MAIIATVSIGTGNKVSVDYQSQEASINVTYQLERTDTDLKAFLHEKAAEVEDAHSLLWRRIRELRTDAKGKESPPPATQPASPAPAPADPEPRPAESSARRRSSARVAADPAPRNGEVAVSAPAPAPEAKAVAAPQGNGAKPAAPTPGNGSVEAISTAQQRAILTLANRARMNDVGLNAMLNVLCGKTSLEQLTKQEAAQVLVELQRSGS